MLPRRKRRLPPKSPDPPEGMTYFYRELVSLEYVERHAKRIMRGFDSLPRKQRDLQNYSERPGRTKKRSRR